MRTTPPPGAKQAWRCALDIYRELRQALVLWDAGDHDGALWNLRWGFDHHWGEHAARAIQALHAYLTDPKIGEDSDSDGD